MSAVEIDNINPIALTAIITYSGNGYTVGVVYGTVNTDDITDDFDTMPSNVTVNVTSSSVPAGYHLATTGDGSWTSSSDSAISGVFAGSGAAPSVSYSFTIIVTDGTTVLARHDPRLTLRRVADL